MADAPAFRNFLAGKFDPAWLEYLEPAERLELAEGLESLVGGETLHDWIVRNFPDEPPPSHMRPVIDAVQRARVQPIRLCISVGPGHAKTTILLRAIVWWLTRSPADQCAYVTYSQDQAQSKSRIARDYSEHVGLRLNGDALGHWTTNHGGGLIAAGARGKLTGQRVPGLLVVDDPYKDELEARSPAINTQVKERFKAIAFTRLQGGSIIVLHTRWAEDDLIGWLTRELGWEYVNIATVCDDPAEDALGRREGEVAWPGHYPYLKCEGPCGHDGHLEEIRATIGEHLWAAMYQGRPRPLGTAIFHEPARYSISDFKWLGKRGVISIDPAATASTSADWSVVMTLAMEHFGVDTIMWIRDVQRVQREIPDLVALARRTQIRTKLLVACEAVAGFKGVPQMLRSIESRDAHGRPMGKLRVVDVTPGSKNKFTRAQPVAAAWNAGRVLVPIDADWADDMIDRFQRFTGSGGSPDDEVDAASQGWNVLYRETKPRRKESYEGGHV